KTPMMTWIRGRTFQDVYGYEKSVDGHRETRPSYTKDQYAFNRNGRRWIRKLPNYKYQDHFDRKATHYYFGDPTGSSTLVMIDIDVQKAEKQGSTAGAWAFAEHLKKFWPGLYCEPSTGGKGVH